MQKPCIFGEKNFVNKWYKLEKMGFKDDFKRLWEYYLIYCEEGFKAETINVHQFLLKKQMINKKNKLLNLKFEDFFNGEVIAKGNLMLRYPKKSIKTFMLLSRPLPKQST